MTIETRRRIEQALAETIEALSRAERYSYEFRDHALIAFYVKHIEKLKTMLAAQ